MMKIEERNQYVDMLKFLLRMYIPSKKTSMNYWKWQMEEVETKLSIINWIEKECWE